MNSGLVLPCWFHVSELDLIPGSKSWEFCSSEHYSYFLFCHHTQNQALSQMDKRAVLCYLHSHPGQRPRKCTSEGQEIYLSFAPAMKTQVEQLRMQTPFPSDLTSGMSPPLSEPVSLVCKRGVITS